MQDEPPHAAPGWEPDAPSAERRQTTAWRTRRRYRRAQWLLAATGLAIALAVVAASVAALPDPAMALERGFLAQSVVLLVAAGGVPWVVVGSLGRRAWRRHL